MYSPAVEAAIAAALAAHAGQTRKSGLGVPYAVHPLHMALMLANMGAGQTAIVAALLHDAVEDCPSQWSLARIEREFGVEVAGIVGELSEDKSRTWEERKRAGIAKVAHMSVPAATVKAVDKLHNLHSLAAALSATSDPASVWQGFRGGRANTLELSGQLVHALRARVHSQLALALESAWQAVLEADRARAN